MDVDNFSKVLNFGKVEYYLVISSIGFPIHALGIGIFKSRDKVGAMSVA
jgi:hypothetical protein